jgi:hypothetical protein
MRSSESGNVIYFILIAIVLLAALSVAVSQGGRFSTTSLSADQQRLLATEIIDYGDTMAKAVAQLRLRGVQISQLSFAWTSLPAGYGVYNASPATELFNPSGGGIDYKQPPANAMATPGDYIFTAANEIYQVGTTCGSASCTDLIMLAGPLKDGMCTTINTILGVANPSSLPPEDTDGDLTTLYAGTATYTATIGNKPSSAPLAGKTAACYRLSGSNQDYFYQVLIPR